MGFAAPYLIHIISVCSIFPYQQVQGVASQQRTMHYGVPDQPNIPITT